MRFPIYKYMEYLSIFIYRGRLLGLREKKIEVFRNLFQTCFCVSPTQPENSTYALSGDEFFDSTNLEVEFGR
jgi:hypothetical protein